MMMITVDSDNNDNVYSYIVLTSSKLNICNKL